MFTKNRKKLIKSLKQKKYRDAHGLFLVEGEKMVHEVISLDNSAGFKVEDFYTVPSLSDKFPEANIISEEDMRAITALKNHSGVLAVVKQKNQTKNWQSAQDKSVLMLDNIKDPGNLGTIIRSAEWFGIKDIIVSPETVESYNPKTVQSTMGSIFRVQMWRENLVESLSKLHEEGYISYAAEMKGNSLKETVWSPKKVLIIGSEAHGLSDEVKGLTQNFVHIEGKGKAESLNAGVAASIILSHWN